MGLAAHTPPAAAANTAAVAKKDPLLEEISTLLAADEDGSDPERLERILTDGYARALSLEAERRRLQKQIGELTATAGGGDITSRQELAALIRRVKRQEGDLGLLRAQLGRLRRRHSSLVRART
jgi:chromosome segregation and condensation protein ScpB